MMLMLLLLLLLLQQLLLLQLLLLQLLLLQLLLLGLLLLQARNFGRDSRSSSWNYGGTSRSRIEDSGQGLCHVPVVPVVPHHMQASSFLLGKVPPPPGSQRYIRAGIRIPRRISPSQRPRGLLNVRG